MTCIAVQLVLLVQTARRHVLQKNTGSDVTKVANARMADCVTPSTDVVVV